MNNHPVNVSREILGESGHCGRLVTVFSYCRCEAFSLKGAALCNICAPSGSRRMSHIPEIPSGHGLNFSVFPACPVTQNQPLEGSRSPAKTSRVLLCGPCWSRWNDWAEVLFKTSEASIASYWRPCTPVSTRAAGVTFRSYKKYFAHPSHQTQLFLLSRKKKSTNVQINYAAVDFFLAPELINSLWINHVPW